MANQTAQSENANPGPQVDLNDVKFDMGDLYFQAKTYGRLCRKLQQEIQQLKAYIAQLEGFINKESVEADDGGTQGETE